MATTINAIQRQPTELDYADPTKFKFSITKLPKVEFFTTQASVPGVTLGEAVFPTPFKEIPTQGDQLTFDNLEVTFIVDDKLGTPTYTFDFALSLLKHYNEKLPYGIYNMVCKGNASRYDVALEIKKILKLDYLKITKVDSSYFKNTYFAPRPPSEKLINSKLEKLNKNYMRDWKVCLKEYLKVFYEK